MLKVSCARSAVSKKLRNIAHVASKHGNHRGYKCNGISGSMLADILGSVPDNNNGEPSPMKLYVNPLSTYSHKAMIACHEAGVDVELEVINLMDEAAKKAYREIYPIGKVPCLIADDGHMIPESTIIIEYLNQEHGANLIPADPTAARQTRFRDRMLDNYLSDAIGTLFFQNMRPEDQRDKERVDQANFSRQHHVRLS